MKTSRLYTANDIVELNNAAILKMRRRDHDAANMLLHQALENLKDIYDDDGSSCSTQASPRKRARTSLDQENSSRRCEEKDSSAATPEGSSEDEDAKNKKVGILYSIRIMEEEGLHEESSIPSDNILTFYDRAFIFLNYHEIDFQTPENKSSLSAMLLYNLAVSHHSQGIRQGCTDELAKALRFYRLAHCILEKVKDVVRLEVHLLILMGLLCNMGHVHATYFNQEQTQRCIEWLQRAVTSRHSTVLEDIDYEFFYTHLKVIPVDHLKFAPAA